MTDRTSSFNPSAFIEKTCEKGLLARYTVPKCLLFPEARYRINPPIQFPNPPGQRWETEEGFLYYLAYDSDARAWILDEAKRVCPYPCSTVLVEYPSLSTPIPIHSFTNDALLWNMISKRIKILNTDSWIRLDL